MTNAEIHAKIPKSYNISLKTIARLRGTSRSGPLTRWPRFHTILALAAAAGKTIEFVNKKSLTSAQNRATVSGRANRTELQVNFN